MAKTEYPYADPDDLFIIGLDTDDDEKHELFDERAHAPLDPNLVRNISVYGVLQPVIVREEAGKKYVVDGRQRVRAARRAKSKQAEAGEVEVRVPYLTSVVKGADRQRLAGVMVSTNEQRRADDILVKAAKASRMIALGSDMDEVAIAFGRSTTTIRQWLNLLESHPTLVQAVRHELIAVSAAHEVAKYPKEEQVGVLQALRQQSGGSRVTEALAKAYRQENGDSTASAAHTAAATSPAA
jgi:ParB-like chromosome segregation protein Spo0J